MWAMRTYPALSALAVAAVISAAGCATVAEVSEPVSARNGVVALALTRPVAELDAGSDGDPAQAMALSLLYRYGLMDLPKDPARADALRAQAMRAGGPLVLTQYIAGLNGAPGRVVPLIVPRMDASGTIAAAELCARALEGDPVEIAGHDGYGEMDPAAVEACGGDAAFSALVRAWREAGTWRAHPLPRCDPADNRCAVLSSKIARLNARDPGAEARAAAARGDYRLGAFNHIGPMPQGWHLPGVSCRAWSRDLIGPWHVTQDVIFPGDNEHTQASVGFIAAYNRAMVGTATFPYRDVCKAGIGEPAATYAGPVATWTEYARAGDAGAPTPAGTDIDQTDVFGRTAFEWAGEASNAPMMIRLLAAGADPNRTADSRSPTPLALALARRQFDLAEALMAGGAKMTGETRLCASPGFIMPGDPGQGGICTWVGLLIERGRPDWIGRAVADGGGYGLWDAYFSAIETGDEPMARRLAALIGGPGAEGPLQKTWRLNRPDLALVMVANGGYGVARSATEQRVWKAAADGGHVEALAFVYQYGADLNLLDSGRASACEGAAGQGDVAALLACVTEASQRRQAMVGQLESGDLAGFRRAVATATDLQEEAKPTMLERAALRADAETVALMLERGALPERSRPFFYGDDPVPAQPYTGPLRAQADTQALASGYADASVPNSAVRPLSAAVSRRDGEMLRLLVRHGAAGLRWIALSQGMAGSPPVNMMEESRDVSALPDRPSPEQMRSLQFVIPELANETDGAAALEQVFRTATTFGYDDVLRLIVDSGFDPRQAKEPDQIWQAWAGLGSACKPSTGRLLVQYGVDARYPLDPPRTGWLPQKIVAVACRNPDSASVLVEAGLAPINELDAEGRSVLDEALARPYRPMMQAALRSLGGLPGEEVDPAGQRHRMTLEREGGDLDLEQSDRQ